MLPLVESFLSIQGEGKHALTPSVFFRFGGCNLSCKGFGCEFLTHSGEKLVGCDSLYAVDKKHFGSSWQKVGAEFLIERAKTLSAQSPKKPHIVLTGGEPTIHFSDENLRGFIKWALSQNFEIFVETNGSVWVDFEKFREFKELGFALSVKLSNSLEPYDRRVKREVFTSIVKNAKEAFFKFVVDKDTLEAAKAEIDDITRDIEAEIFCMPLGFNKDELEKNSAAVIGFCIKNGYNYSDRIHIRTWNDKRGV